jgi:hypothetical protein
MQTLELGIFSLQDNVMSLEGKYSELVNFYKGEGLSEYQPSEQAILDEVKLKKERVEVELNNLLNLHS